VSSLSGAIGSLNPTTLTVTRTPAGRNRRGVYVAAPDVDAVVNVDGAGDMLRLVAHGLMTGDGPVQVRADASPPAVATLPTGLDAAAFYWVIRVDEDSIQLAASFQAAVAGEPVEIGDDGAGDVTLFASRSFLIEAGVQSAGGRNLQFMPAGMNAEETLCLYTETMLIGVLPAAEGQPAYEPDSVTITWMGQTEDWTVQKCEQFLQISGHYRAWVFRTVVP
jgi:hypothetical protein